jgi:hypothetical protein
MYASPRRVDFTEGYHVRLRAALNRGEGRLMTLSAGGAYVATPVNLLPQAQLSVAIDIPELEQTVEVEAIVAWENRGTVRRSAQPEGYGLRFIRVPSASEEAIQWLLKRDEGAELDPARTRALSPREVRDAIEKAQAIYGDSARRVPHPANPLVEPAAVWDPTPPATDEPETFEPIELVVEEDEPDGPPYRLTASSLESRVPLSSPGVFVLSYDGRLDARIGRADADLRRALAEFIDQYAYFHFEVVAARRERFERECELFHRLGGDRRQLDNEEHPLPPAGPQLKCPVCVKRASV